MTDSSCSVETEWITTADHHEIFTKTWKPSGEIKAIVIIVHGFGEHVTRFDAMARQFAEHGFLTYGYDQRGFGETGKKSKDFGNNGGYATVLQDVDAAIERIAKQGVPLFLFGHSMGGAIILNYLSMPETYSHVMHVTGAIASAPLITLTKPPSLPLYYSLRAASRVLPSFVFNVNLSVDALSHDKEEVKKYQEDPLVHNFATLATLRGFLDAGRSLLTKGSKIQTPILFSHGTDDDINLHESTRQVYEVVASKDKTMKSWDGLYHELHLETKSDREQVVQVYCDWIKARL